jgi:hypothetical protein
MRRKDSVFIHSLLVEVAVTLEEHGQINPKELEEYQKSEYAPAKINENKAFHEAAIWLLLDTIETALEEESLDQPPERPQQANAD